MNRERKFELLQEAAETWSKLSEIYTELTEVFFAEGDNENGVRFLDKQDIIIREQRLLSKFSISNLGLDRLVDPNKNQRPKK